jgi:hypothetical protein
MRVDEENGGPANHRHFALGFKRRLWDSEERRRHGSWMMLESGAKHQTPGYVRMLVWAEVLPLRRVAVHNTLRAEAGYMLRASEGRHESFARIDPCENSTHGGPTAQVTAFMDGRGERIRTLKRLF